LRTHSKMKELETLAAGLPTIFQDREDVAAGGFGSYRLCQRHTSLEVRQVFMAGPDDEQVEAPTFLRGDPLRITEGAVTGNGTPKTRAKNARFDARERHL
jgi:hypothetical protein